MKLIDLDSISVTDLEKICLQKARTLLRRITPPRFKLRNIHIIKRKVTFWVEDWETDTIIDYSGMPQGQPGTWITLNARNLEKESTKALVIKKLKGRFDNL